MESEFLERFRERLLVQHRNLTEWLRNTPTQKKQVRLGPADEQAVEAHLQVLEIALEKTEDKTLGLCEVCHDYVETGRLEIDYTTCVCIDHLSGEEKRRLEFELELSQKVQQALLPQEAPDIPGLELAAFTQPAQIVGGDYFDFFRFRDDSHGVAIADVMGKGMSASLLMASLQASLRILVPEHDSPADVSQRLNLLFCHNIHLTQFVTLFLAQFEPKSHSLSYCNAGHNPPLLFRSQQENGKGPMAWLRPTGAAIGLVEEFQFNAETITLSSGDILVLYTDGVTEATNAQQEEFGQARLAELVRREANLPAKKLVGELRHLLQEFTGGQPLADDTTIVVCKVEK